MDPYVYRLTRFILLLAAFIPSFICYLLVFVFLFKTRQITSKHLQHHFVFALLLMNFIFITTELQITLIYSYQGYAPIQTVRFCSFWVAYNYGMYIVALYLMAFGSIERYFLIFHERSVRRCRRVFHYPFIIFCITYPLTFYPLIVNLYPCEDAFYYDAYVCGGDCYQFLPVVATIDYLTNVFTPAVVVIVANAILLSRVVMQKRAMKVANTWRRNRLMYIQLLSISILYFVVWIPYVIIAVIRLLHDPLFLNDVTITLLLNDGLYICPLASPFISLVGLPAVRQRLRESFSCMIGLNQHANNRIEPIPTVMTQNRRRRTKATREFDEHTF